MSRPQSNTTASAATLPTIRPAVIRVGLGLAVLAALTAFAVRASAQAPARAHLDSKPALAAETLLASNLRAQPAASPFAISAPTATFFAPAPFAVGEELTYKATFGVIPAGTAKMRVDGIEIVRGRPAYRIVFTIDGGVPFFRVRDRYESWIDVQTLPSLRYRQQISEGRYTRNTTYEIYPERAAYQKNDEPLEASVANPLDEGSLIYAARVAKLRVGETWRDDRYFMPDRNPVILTGLRAESITVNAGTFQAIVVKPSIKANGLFSENGDAQIWFSDDAARYPVQLKTKFSKFSLTLALQSVTPGDPSTHQRLLSAARGER